MSQASPPIFTSLWSHVADITVRVSVVKHRGHSGSTGLEFLTENLECLQPTPVNVFKVFLSPRLFQAHHQQQQQKEEGKRKQLSRITLIFVFGNRI